MALPLLARDIYNITGPSGLKYGIINANHTSNLTAGWTPGTLPTPFPLVIASSLVSLALAFIGWKTAMSTMVSTRDDGPHQVQVERPAEFESWTYGQRWAWAKQNAAAVRAQTRRQREDAEQNYVALHPLDNDHHSAAGSFGNDGMLTSTPSKHNYALLSAEQDMPPPYNQSSSYRTPHEPILQWQDSLKTRIVVLVSAGYNTLRAVFAAVTTLEIAATHKGTHSAVSSLFLLYLSLQTFVSNRKLPRVITFLLVLDLCLVGIAFLVASWDFNAHSYGDSIIMGGNCAQSPAYGQDCRSQMSQWNMVGCGSIVPAGDVRNSNGDQVSSNPNAGHQFYPPYANGGSINSGDKLETIESVMGGLGTFWVGITLLITIYEAIRTFLAAETWAHLLWPIPYQDQFATNKKTGKVRRRIGWGALSFFAFFALGGAFVVTILSIAGHTVSETHTSSAMYIDSFGPPIHLNFTRKLDSTGFPVTNLTSPIGGNATSWTDCFTISLPKSSDGFLGDWVQHNSQVALRFASLL